MRRSRNKQTKKQKLWYFLVNEFEIFKFVFLFCYIMLGGFLFASKEASMHEFSHSELRQAQDRVIDSLNQIELSASNFIPDKNNYCQFGDVKGLLTKRAKHILHNFDLLQYNRTVDWSYGIAMYYSFVQITTIGYGDFVPASIVSKLLTVLYAAIGIPMCISVFQKVGNLFAISLYNCWNLFKYKMTNRYMKTVSPPVYSKNPRNIPTIFLVNVNIIFIAFCACVLPYFSKLSYLDSYYFFVITMSTIGFGDIYPSSSSYSLVLFLTCFGIGLTATLFSNIRKNVKLWENALVHYINELHRTESFKRVDQFSLFRPSAVEKSIATSATGEITSESEENDEEAYVVDFERCVLM